MLQLVSRQYIVTTAARPLMNYMSYHISRHVEIATCVSRHRYTDHDDLGEGPSATRNSDYDQVNTAGHLAQTDVEDDTRTMAEVAYDTINQPGLDFFLKAQAFTSRIISLDRYHRSRGTLETEFETLKDGQKISEDLHTLWATRPTTMSFLRDPQGLDQALQPSLARRILLNLRVYVVSVCNIIQCLLPE